jgi:adenine-specific DNA methylase
MQIQEGNILKSSFWPEKVRVISAKTISENQIKIEAVGLETTTFYSTILSDDEIKTIEILEERPFLFSADGESLFLYLESHRIRNAFQFDPLYAVNVSKIDPLPDEPLPRWDLKGRIIYGAGMRFVPYGFYKWGDVFDSRQKLALITFAEKVREAYGKMQPESADEYKNAVASYLALGINMIGVSCNTLCRWEPTRQLIADIFARQSIPMIWDYVELNPFGEGSGSWKIIYTNFFRYITHASQISNFAVVSQSSATFLPYPDKFFDAVITDPPYYDYVPYSDLSDFFYVWLKRTISELYPELFATPLTPKAEEIVDTLDIMRGIPKAEAKQAQIPIKDKGDFERMLTQAFVQIHRVLKPNGIACIVFAHSSTEAWETTINALLNSGLYLTASWPVHTEMKERLTAKGTAAALSSIYMVCRKRTEKNAAYYNEIKSRIEVRIKEKLDQFWNEGIGGSDFFISAIGPAMEVFGKYESVEKLSGEKVSAKELLEFVRKSVSEYALAKILKSPQLGGIDEETRFYLLWRWTYNSAKVHFDDARKLAQAVGIEITEQWGNGFIKKDKEFISVLSPKERVKGWLEKRNFESIVDVIHASLLYWEQNNRKAITELLETTGNLNNNEFWQVAQAISEVLPEGDKEKQMLQGFLYGKGSYGKEAKVDKYQKTLI